MVYPFTVPHLGGQGPAAQQVVHGCVVFKGTVFLIKLKRNGIAQFLTRGVLELLAQQSYAFLLPGHVNAMVLDGLIEAGINGIKVVKRLGRDRKSTRLNSSHANISYAVFCLKKKTIYRSFYDSSTFT